MMLLSVVAAEEGRVMARLFVIRIEKLPVEGDLSSARPSQRGIQTSGAGKELMKFESEESSIAASVPLARRLAHENEH